MQSKESSIWVLLENAAKVLQDSAILRPLLEAEILLSFVLNCKRVFLHGHPNALVSAFLAESFMQLIKRRSLHEPLEYLIESVSFYGEEFYITYGALIPRPETEILVSRALEIIQRYKLLNVAEVGVGSGVISVLLAHNIQNATFHASDIAPEALFNAYVNKMRFACSNLTLHHCAYLDFNKTFKREFNLLVSNPPYIKNGTILPKSLDYEPKCALFGGERGDEVLLQVIDNARFHKIPFVLCEMGYNQRENVERYLQNIPHKQLEFYKDLAGLDRGFFIEF